MANIIKTKHRELYNLIARINDLLKKNNKEQIRWLLSELDNLPEIQERFKTISTFLIKKPKSIFTLGLELVCDGKEIWFEQNTNLQDKRRYLEPADFPKLYDLDFLEYKLKEIISQRRHAAFTKSKTTKKTKKQGNQTILKIKKN